MFFELQVLVHLPFYLKKIDKYGPNSRRDKHAVVHKEHFQGGRFESHWLWMFLG